jgi:hypothetical protein
LGGRPPPATTAICLTRNSISHWMARHLLLNKITSHLNTERAILGLVPLPTGTEYSLGPLTKRIEGQRRDRTRCHLGSRTRTPPDRFLELLKAGVYGAELNALAGKLWNCTDIIAGSDCNWLDVQVGSTYAQLARRIRSAG